MRARLALIAAAAAGLAGVAHAQPKPPAAPGCPTIEMTSEFDKVPPGKQFHFVVTVQGVLADPTYNWSVSAGAIESGQGRSVISVSAPPGSMVTATVQIGGFPAACDLVTSKTVEVSR
jgi:hypothetical protein